MLNIENILVTVGIQKKKMTLPFKMNRIWSALEQLEEEAAKLPLWHDIQDCFIFLFLQDDAEKGAFAYKVLSEAQTNELLELTVEEVEV